jgi:hypothetical protein
MPNNIRTFGKVMTDQSKKLILDFAYEYTKSGDGSATNYTFGPGVSVRPIQYLKVGVTANYADNYDNLQYVTEENYMSEKRYILGTIDQRTLGLTFRLDLNITPEFSVQYYGSPFVSMGKYSAFKKVTTPDAESYNDRFALLSTNLLPSGEYGVDDDNDMAIDYTIENPDFNFHEFRSNMVAKWEYRLGSFIYFVWSRGKTGTSGSSDISFGESYKELRSIYPENIFLIKLNYWFTL